MHSDAASQLVAGLWRGLPRTVRLKSLDFAIDATLRMASMLGETQRCALRDDSERLQRPTVAHVMHVLAEA